MSSAKSVDGKLQAELTLIDEYESVVQPRVRGPRADVVRGTIQARGFEAGEPAPHGDGYRANVGVVACEPAPAPAKMKR